MWLSEKEGVLRVKEGVGRGWFGREKPVLELSLSDGSGKQIGSGAVDDTPSMRAAFGGAVDSEGGLRIVFRTQDQNTGPGGAAKIWGGAPYHRVSLSTQASVDVPATNYFAI